MVSRLIQEKEKGKGYRLPRAWRDKPIEPDRVYLVLPFNRSRGQSSVLCPKDRNLSSTQLPGSFPPAHGLQPTANRLVHGTWSEVVSLMDITVNEWMVHATKKPPLSGPHKV